MTQHVELVFDGTQADLDVLLRSIMPWAYYAEAKGKRTIHKFEVNGVPIPRTLKSATWVGPDGAYEPRWPLTNPPKNATENVRS